MSHARRASQRDLRNPGKGILGFGAAVWIVLDIFARSCRDVWWCSFVALQDLLIHWHISCLPHWSCLLIGPDFSGCLVRFGSCCFSLIDKTSEGRCFMHLANSFISITLCDDLARAEKAMDGKKILSHKMDVRQKLRKSLQL